MKILSQKKGEVCIKICDDEGKPFTATLYNVLLAPYLCDGLFYIITLMNLGQNYLFHGGYCTVLFSDNQQHAVKLPHSGHRKHAFTENKKIQNTKQPFPKR